LVTMGSVMTMGAQAAPPPISMRGLHDAALETAAGGDGGGGDGGGAAALGVATRRYAERQLPPSTATPPRRAYLTSCRARAPPTSPAATARWATTMDRVSPGICLRPAQRPTSPHACPCSLQPVLSAPAMEELGAAPAAQLRRGRRLPISTRGLHDAVEAVVALEGPWPWVPRPSGHGGAQRGSSGAASAGVQCGSDGHPKRRRRVGQGPTLFLFFQSVCRSG